MDHSLGDAVGGRPLLEFALGDQILNFFVKQPINVIIPAHRGPSFRVGETYSWGRDHGGFGGNARNRHGGFGGMPSCARNAHKQARQDTGSRRAGRAARGANGLTRLPPPRALARPSQACRNGLMHRATRHRKCARDRGLVVIVAGYNDLKIEPGEHLNIAAVGELGADSPSCWKMPNFAESRRSDFGSGEVGALRSRCDKITVAHSIARMTFEVDWRIEQRMNCIADDLVHHAAMRDDDRREAFEVAVEHGDQALGVRHGGEAFHVGEAVTSRRSPESFTAPGSATMRLTTVGGRCCSSAR
jgi:hypothetical protein